MSSGNKWNKTINFGSENKEIINRIFANRNKELYPLERDLALHLFEEYDKTINGVSIPNEVITPEQLKLEEDLKKLCGRGLLKKIGGESACTRRIFSGGIQRVRYFRYGDGHPKAGKRMSYKDIVEICDSCNIEFTEDKRIQELKRMFALKEVTMYMCKSPDCIDSEVTMFKDSKFVCPSQNGRQVRIDRTCMDTECEYLEVLTLPYPSRINKES